MSKMFLSIENGQFSSNAQQMMAFLNPLDALIPEIPFSFFFAKFWARVTAGARGSVSVGFWGGGQLSPFWGGGGASQGLYSPCTPQNVV